MSLSELKEQAAAHSLDERLHLAVFLDEVDEQKEAEFRATVNLRMNAMDQGCKVTMEQFEKEHLRSAE